VNKQTKSELRQLAKTIGEITGRAEVKSLVKQLDFAISRAWEEGVQEKAKLYNALGTVKRLDEEEITRRVKEQVDGIQSLLAKQVDDNFATHCTAREEQHRSEIAAYEALLVECREQTRKYATWFTEHCEGVDSAHKKIRMMLFGDFEDELEAARCAYIGFWNCMANAERAAKVDGYQVVVFPDRRVDEWVFYVAIFTAEEWRKFTFAECHRHIPVEFKHFLKKLMRKNPS